MDEGKYGDKAIEGLAKAIYTGEMHHKLKWNVGCTCRKVGQLFITCGACQPSYDAKIHEIKLLLRDHLMQEVENFIEALKEEIVRPGGSMKGIYKIIKARRLRYDDIRRRYRQ